MSFKVGEPSRGNGRRRPRRETAPGTSAIVVLGAPNDKRGALSPMARGRCALALAEFRLQPDRRIITTGGWGAHFNTAPKPHGWYTRRWLQARDVPAEAFLEIVESANTVEDARLCRPVVERCGLDDLLVVTSDFHVPRARFLFEREFPDKRLRVVGCRTRVSLKTLRRLKAHEAHALARLKAAADGLPAEEARRDQKEPVRESIAFASAECPVVVQRTRSDRTRSGLACHREWECQLILRGRGFYFIGGKKYPFRPNTALVIQPNEPHFFELAPGCRGDKWTVMFFPGKLGDTARALTALPRQALLADREAAALVLLVQRIRGEIQSQESHWQTLVRLMLGEYLWLLNRAGERPLPPPVTHPLAQQLTDHIERHFTQRLTLPDLASAFGYSAGYLSHVFKRYSGFGIKHYLLQRRIAEARVQLEGRPGLKMAAVARDVGFEDFGLFNRLFKRMVGVTPAVYSRNSHPDSRM